MAGDGVKIYYMSLSQPSRTLVLIAKAANIPHKEIVVDLTKGEHKTPEYLAMNPFHTVPTLADGDFAIVESVASAKYLVTKGAQDHWYPADAKKRARVDEFLAWQHTAIRTASIKVAMSHAFMEMFTGKKASEEEKDAAMKLLDQKLSDIESYFLKDKKFLAGDEISIADVFGVSEIEQCVVSKKDYLKGHDKVKAWIDRVKAKTNPHYDQVFHDLYNFGK